MAIIRVSGGNSGIAEYLRKGQKQGRAFNRDELDKRICLDGNLSTTESVINSIEDKDQDRYLHITISFRESIVPIETLEAVTQSYKEILLSSYEEDEFNFYAEAHLPKIKSITDRSTGEEKERKPHIHIVIPKTNLLSGKSLDPIGLYMHHEKYHEAIQEKINNDFSLENPKDFIRISDNHQAEILSRVKADSFKGNGSKIKESIYNELASKNFNKFEEFIDNLSKSYSEVRVRNKGSQNEYIAIKVDKSDNYINLKSPLFRRDFIESGKLERPKPNSKEVDNLVKEWKGRVSKEIKYINRASKKTRSEYKSLSQKEKANFILNRERGFYENFGQRANREQGDKERSYQNSLSRDITSLTAGLPEMRSRELVPDLGGYEYSGREREFNSSETRESGLFLREVQNSSVADGQQEQYKHNGLRRSARDYAGVDSITESIEQKQIEQKQASTDSEISEFRKIRMSLSGEFLLNKLSESHGIDSSKYELKSAKDGSARINCGKLNLNVSDFLTKEMNFSWDEAKSYLRKTYDEQLSNEMSQDKVKFPKEVWESFNSNYRPIYFNKIKEIRKELNQNCKELRYESKKRYFSEKKNIFDAKMSYAERKAALSIAVFNKLKTDREIRSYQRNERSKLFKLENTDIESLIINYVNNNEGGKNMARLSDLVGSVSEKNSFSPFEPEYGVNLKKHMSEIQQSEEFNSRNKKRLELSDLSPSKQENGDVKYKTSLLGTAFIDKGNKIEFPTLTLDKDKIALGLELAAEKYQGKIQLTGLPSFKEKAIEIAAERGLEVEFKPKKYQEMFEELKQKQNLDRDDLSKEKAPVEQRETTSQARDRAGEAELTMSAVSLHKLPPTELSREDWRELSNELSQKNISLKEFNTVSKGNTDLSVGQVIDDIREKPEELRSATALEMNVSTVYDQDSNRTKLMINDLPMDIFIQTASEIHRIDPETIKMPLLVNDELSVFTSQQIDQGFAEGQVNVPNIVINENGRSTQNDVRVEFEPIDGDSTAYRVIVNGQPLKESHKPDSHEAKIISDIKSVLAQEGITTTYFSSADQSVTAKEDRDIKRAETELAKEQVRQDHYIKSGQHGTAEEHKKEVIDYLKDKVQEAKEQREQIALAYSSNSVLVDRNLEKDMTIATKNIPKSFLLSDNGKAFNDEFKQAAFSPYTNQEKQKSQQTQQSSQTQKQSIEPKLSFDR